jgi:hypothetical protein
MGRVTIVCPTTGREVATGITMERAEFERAALENNVFRCSACGRIHVWSKKDARFRETPEN